MIEMLQIVSTDQINLLIASWKPDTINIKRIMHKTLKPIKTHPRDLVV